MLAKAHTSDNIGTSQPILVNKTTLAQALSVSPRQVGYWMEEGRIPFLRIGSRCTRFKIADVVAALEGKGGLQ